MVRPGTLEAMVQREEDRQLKPPSDQGLPNDLQKASEAAQRAIRRAFARAKPTHAKLKLTENA